MPTPNSSKWSLEEEKTEKVSTPALQQILEDIKMSLWETISEADLKSPKIRALIAAIFPEIEQVLNAWKKSLAENAVKIEWWLENVFEINLTNFPWKISLCNIREEWLEFVNKSWERAFDSILSLWDNFLATKNNWVVFLENLKTWVYIKWSEEPHTIIDRRKYKSKIKQIEKNKAKLEFVAKWNYHNLITVLNSIDTIQKVKLLNEIYEGWEELIIDELVKIISKKLGISEDAADQMLQLEEVVDELYIKYNEEIDKRLSKTKYNELKNEVIKSILSDSSNWILESVVYNHLCPLYQFTKILVLADKWYIEVSTEEWIKHIYFDEIIFKLEKKSKNDKK